ncbi:hypothetical protein QWZ08_18360 [Ferruginibacter paludis]|uniref:hypothetical protein n=1 Tax=Ferruginibacter paludis TaxID=1310417 RepID=UPI0025B58E2D|nr:hypothetical protein [Ferruginibacter paludis]MDN3657622.1 hypothetical protein [Ferruginibacter paludis]
MSKILTQIVTQRGYLYLLKKLAAFMVLFILFDFIIGSFFRYLYFRQTSGWEFRTKYSVEDTRADILIFGASRAQQQYNPIFFEERLHQTCYNVGRDGQPIFYYYGILNGVLRRYSPKMIFLDIENGVFNSEQSSYDRIGVLLPFYKTHAEMRQVIELKSPYEKMKLQSSIYPFNSLLFKIAVGNTKFNKNRNEDIKGYIPLSGELHEPIRTVSFLNQHVLDTNKINVYRSFINDCIKHHIKLYIVCSPYYMKTIGTDTSISIAKKIAHENNVDFIDYSKDELFLTNSTLFDDTVHVNVAGARIFSNKLIDNILVKE